MGPDPAELSAPSVPEQLSGPGMGQNNALLAQQQQAQQMIKQLLLKRLLQQQGGGGLGMQPQPLPQMLGMPPPRPVPQMIPGQTPAGMQGVRG